MFYMLIIGFFFFNLTWSFKFYLNKVFINILLLPILYLYYNIFM